MQTHTAQRLLETEHLIFSLISSKCERFAEGPRNSLKAEEVIPKIDGLTCLKADLPNYITFLSKETFLMLKT